MKTRAKAKALRQGRARVAVLVLSCLLVCAAAVLSNTAQAADEDTQASVYLVFDPETGEFVTVHEGDSASQQGGDANGGAGTDAAAAAAPDAGTAGATTPAPNPTLIAGLVVAAVLVLGGAALFRRSRA